MSSIISSFQVSCLFNTLSICTYDMRKPIQFIQLMLFYLSTKLYTLFCYVLSEIKTTESYIWHL